MPNTPRPSPAPLPFEEWVNITYPNRTPARKFLKLVGALDVAYLLYRFHTPIIPVPPEQIAEHALPMKVSAPVAELQTPVKPVKKAKKSAPRTGKKKKTAAKTPEVTLEFSDLAHIKLDEHPLPSVQESPQAESEQVPEPQPLELDESAPEASDVSTSRLVWLDNEKLDETDPRKTKLHLGINHMPVGFETRDSEDERETLLTVGDASYVLTLLSPAMNLSRMVQTMRISHGELYVHGRAALGVLSGEGYIAADECARIVRELYRNEEKIVELVVEYFTKDKTSRQREPSVMKVRFEKVS